MTNTDAPDEAFALLGNETRIAILRALSERPYEPMSFSELREQVGMKDSGQFNYHLGKLVGRFIRKEPEGYQLRLAGWNVVGALRSGSYDPPASAITVAYDDPCPACGGTVLARYEDERMTIACDDCDEQFSNTGLPPGIIEGYDTGELPDVFDRFMHAIVDQVKRGFCVSCKGRIVPSVQLEPDETLRISDDDHFPRVRFDCERCPEIITLSMSAAMLDHPAVVAFHYQHGVDLRAQPTWTLEWAHDRRTAVESEDPVRVTVSYELDGDTLDLVVDESLTVVDIAPPPTASSASTR